MRASAASSAAMLRVLLAASVIDVGLEQCQWGPDDMNRPDQPFIMVWNIGTLSRLPARWYMTRMRSRRLNFLAVWPNCHIPRGFLGICWLLLAEGGAP